jgi:histidinol-phosphate/aromatic aminotransferase/cobyric acid decarboxylase-like protein
MRLKFKNGVGIPLTDFQIKLNNVLKLIGATVVCHPNDPIGNVFASDTNILRRK